MRKVVSMVKESGTDDSGNYWSTSYARSRSDDIMDNFRIEFYQADEDHANGHYNVYTIKLGTTKKLSEVIALAQVQQIPKEYVHLLGAALASFQNVTDASNHLGM